MSSSRTSFLLRWDYLIPVARRHNQHAMKKTTRLRLIASLLMLAALGHIGRIVLGWEIVIEGWMMPWWVSLLLGLLVGEFALYLWRHSAK